MITVSDFGRLRDGRMVHCWRICNTKGEYVDLLDFGAAVHRIVVQDREGRPGDVVLGVRDAVQLEEFNLEGSVMGRCAGRIAGARYTLNGHTYELDKGRGGHCLHSGSGNYATRMFRGCIKGPDSVEMQLFDEGRGGFDAEVETSIVFTFDENSALTIHYHMLARGDTVLSPTSHIYFNLGSGETGDHLLQIHASKAAVKGEGDVPRGDLRPVAATELDFRSLRRLERSGWDDNLILDGEGFRRAALLVSPDSGRRMEVFTDMPSLILFTFAADREIPGKDGEVYRGFRSVCLETQFPVNAVNWPGAPWSVYHAGEILDSRTTYRFSTQDFVSGQEVSHA